MRMKTMGTGMLALGAVLAVGGCSKKNNDVDTTMGTSGGNVAPATPNVAATDTSSPMTNGAMNGTATGNAGAAAAGTGTAGPGTPGTSSMSPSTGASTTPSTGAQSTRTPGTGPGTMNDSTTRNRTGSGPGSGTGSKGSGTGSGSKRAY